jgi:uncharacterized protein (DUF1330 family)
VRINRILTAVLVLGIGGILSVAIERSAQAKSAPPAYFVAEVKVKDPNAMKPLRDKVAAVVKRYGGRFIVQGGKTEAVEGKAPDGMVAILEFKSLADAKRWRESPEIKAITASAFQNKEETSPRVFLVEGLPR